MKQVTIVFFSVITIALLAMAGLAGRADAKSDYWTSQYCSACHYDDSASCDGCHAHGAHSDSGKSDINISTATDKTTYSPGETVSVTVDGGYRGGWVRAVLYDENGSEAARSEGPGGTGSGESFPITLTATAPATPGTYTFSASWYGNLNDNSGAAFGNWIDDPNNANHGEEMVSTNSFVVEEAAPQVPDITVTDSVAPNDDLQVAFGTVLEGTSSDQTVTVTNDGAADLTLGVMAASDSLSDPFGIVADNCSGQVLAQGESCTLTVRFSPALEGSYTDSFDVPSDDPDENPVTVSVSGEGTSTPVPDITVTASVAPNDDLQVAFGTVIEGNSSDQTVTVTNDGTADLTLGVMAASDPLSDPFGIVSDGCSGQALAQGESCTLTVRFSPALEGSYTDSFDIPSDDPDENPVTVNVSGDGTLTPVPDITVTDSVAPNDDLLVAFGDVTESTSSDQTVTVTNDGTGDLTLDVMAASDSLSDPFVIVTDNCSGQVLAQGESCTLTVRFSPALEGSYTDSFDVPSDDPDENPVTVSVSGEGLSSAHNNPPSIPELVYPNDGQTGMDTTLDLRWKTCSDPDGDNVRYSLYVSEDPDFADTTPVEIASIVKKGVAYAGTGLGMMLFGIVFSGIKNRRRMLLLISAILIAGALLISCGGGDDWNWDGGSDTSTTTPTTGTEATYELTGLSQDTTYYWKIAADDGNGGTAESEVREFTTR
jgi:hypothetical protein